MFQRLKRIALGEPLVSRPIREQWLPQWKALAVLSSDALSSTAYATEEILLVLVVATAAATAWSVPIAILIVALLTLVLASYRQIIDAYPNGGGAYTVARENLGTAAGLVAGSALLLEYVLMLAVSVAAGVAAATAAFPELQAYRVALGIGAIGLLTWANLRGLRESSTWLALPTYLFVGAMFTVLGLGAWRLLTGELQAAHPIIHESYRGIVPFLVLRAFSSGCAALTGIDAISNAVGAFEAPAARNAKRTMVGMALLLGPIFFGVTALVYMLGITPQEGDTVVSGLARTVLGPGAGHTFVQVSTALVLALAANTAYTRFPLLASLLARDQFLPRQLASLGDKLVFSNGVLGCGGAAAALLFVFGGSVHSLIPLYAVGVFLSYTLAQAGMVARHMKTPEAERPEWASPVLNAVGAAVTGLVLTVTAWTKFTQGAWIVMVLVPFGVWIFTRVRSHYAAVGKELTLVDAVSPGELQKLRHTVIIPVSGIHRGVLDALRYAVSISDDVRACYVELDPVAAERMTAEWNRWAHEIPFVVLKSPYRSVIGPILEYVNDVEQITHNELITVIIPEFVTTKWWHRLLHNQSALLIRAALLGKRYTVVTSVRYHLREG